MLWFFATSGTVLTPLLGYLRTPIFDVLLALYPNSIQDLVIPISSFFTGITSVWVRWNADKIVSNKKLSRWLTGGCVTLFLGCISVALLKRVFCTED